MGRKEVLALLTDRGALTRKELERLTGTGTQAVLEVLRALRRKGLVEVSVSDTLIPIYRVKETIEPENTD